MQIVMGQLNGMHLRTLMQGAAGRCSHVSAAVARADSTHPFFDHCRDNGIFLEYFGLLDEHATSSLPVLQRLHDAGPHCAEARLVKGHCDSRIIWWHGYGAYVGSANLTHDAWSGNVECGVFFEEHNILGQQVGADLQVQFDYLRTVSTGLSQQLLQDLGTLECQQAEDAAAATRVRLRAQIEKTTRTIPPHHGIAPSAATGKEAGLASFIHDWTGAQAWRGDLRGDALQGDDQPATSAHMRAAFAPDRLQRWTLRDFQDTFAGIHAFRMHARQMPDQLLGLPPGMPVSIRQRTDLFATWLWLRPRTPGQHHLRTLLQFLVWGTAPELLAERLWIATRDDRWRYDHFGLDILGEAAGWARPDDFLPRNTRPHPALRAPGQIAGPHPA